MRVLRFLRAEKFVFAEGYVIFLFSTIFQADLGGILTQTGWVARGVLLLLLLFSIISWAMILQKLGMFGRIRRQSNQFLRLFRATRGVANPQALASAGSPFPSGYPPGYPELQGPVGGLSINPHPPKLQTLQPAPLTIHLPPPPQ